MYNVHSGIIGLHCRDHTIFLPLLSECNQVETECVEICTYHIPYSEMQPTRPAIVCNVVRQVQEPFLICNLASLFFINVDVFA